MRISSTYFSSNFLVSTNKLQQQQVNLQNQVTTGLKVSEPEDNPAVMSQVLNLQTAADQNSQYQSNITSLQNSANTSYTALSQLQTLVTQAGTIASSDSNSLTSNTQMGIDAGTIKNYIQEALNIGNTQDAQGNYIFGGTASGTPPFVAATDASGNVTGVTYQGNSATVSAEIARGVRVSANVPGANTTGTGTQGVFTDSQSGVDIFSHLISLQQNLTAGSASPDAAKTAAAAIGTGSVSDLARDGTNATYQMAANASVQATLSNASSAASSQATNLTAQISGLTSADLATTITQLQQTQTAYQAALESGTQYFNLSILDYLH